MFLWRWIFGLCVVAVHLLAAPGWSRGEPARSLLHEFEQTLVDLSERVRPAVVSITQPSPATASSLQRSGDAGRVRPTNSGAGVIYDGKNGYVITNSHVVKGAEFFDIQLSDGTTVIGQVVGTDDDTDLAVVKIDATAPLPEAKLGDSNKVRVGQLVLAVGNPFGLNSTLTFGIVSGMNRENIHIARYENFIQTDASINPGNSGGPLFNIEGEVVGINTAIISYAQNIGFSIPVNVAKDVVPHLIKTGEVERGWLGIGIDPVSAETVAKFSLKAGEGVYVSSLFDGDAAQEAGVKVGDVILRVAGAPVNSTNAMTRIVGATSPGQKIELDIVRDGQRQVIPVKVGQARRMFPHVRDFTKNSLRAIGILVGELRREGGGPPPAAAGKGNVVVTDILPKSRAEARDLQRGDMIVSVNGQEVKSRQQLNDLLQAIPIAEQLVLQIYRNDAAMQVTLPGRG